MDSMAISEVLSILDGFNEIDLHRIPKSFIDFLKENADDTYKPNFDKTREIKDLKLKKETKGLLSVIYTSYFCKSEEEKQKYMKLLRDNTKKREMELQQKYDVYKVFEERQNSKNNESEFCNNNKNMIQYKRETFFTKIINKIKRFFKRRNTK